jgi:hypothetical protein
MSNLLSRNEAPKHKPDRVLYLGRSLSPVARSQGRGGGGEKRTSWFTSSPCSSQVAPRQVVAADRSDPRPLRQGSHKPGPVLRPQELKRACLSGLARGRRATSRRIAGMEASRRRKRLRGTHGPSRDVAPNPPAGPPSALGPSGTRPNPPAAALPQPGPRGPRWRVKSALISPSSCFRCHSWTALRLQNRSRDRPELRLQLQA